MDSQCGPLPSRIALLSASQSDFDCAAREAHKFPITQGAVIFSVGGARLARRRAPAPDNATVKKPFPSFLRHPLLSVLLVLVGSPSIEELTRAAGNF